MVYRAWRRPIGVLLLAMLAGAAAGCGVSPQGAASPTVDVETLESDPVLDGNILTEPVWRDIPRVPLGSGTWRDGFFKVGWRPESKSFYIGFWSRKIPPGTNNRAVLGLVTHSQCAWRIHIYPPGGSGGPTTAPKAWRNAPGPSNNDGWNAAGALPISTPSWLSSGMKFLIVPGRWWSMELKIPINSTYDSEGGIYFPGEGIPFSLYVNVLNSENPSWGGSLQLPWPSTAYILAPWERDTPPISAWGTAFQQP